MSRNKRQTSSNQELRTRKDILLAAGRLLRRGRKPTMDEIADEALVSRATAYRYFGGVDDLLVEVPIDEAVDEPGDIFANDPTDDPEERVDRAEAFIHELVYRNEGQLRILLASSIGRHAGDNKARKRQNRRIPLIEAALSKSRHRFRDEDYERLCRALAMIIGPESMIVFNDVLDIDEATAREVKSWAVRALVRAALKTPAPDKAPSPPGTDQTL